MQTIKTDISCMLKPFKASIYTSYIHNYRSVLGIMEISELYITVLVVLLVHHCGLMKGIML